MAIDEQLETLKRGVEHWNRWRQANAETVIDLSGAGLTNVRLERVDFSQADLSRVDLSGAHLGEANLSGARLIAANLGGADLTAANLRRANIIFGNVAQARLSRANLRGADLRWAILTASELYKADLSQAIVRATLFAAVDLSETDNLATIQHHGPSTVGIDTIYKSKGKIPEVFLRGCGVPDEFIAYVGSMTAQPIEFYSCFISYSSKDQEFADRLYADLQAKGVRCWFAPEDLRVGDKFQERIEDSIRLHDKLLTVLSQNSVGSPWVEREVQAARERDDTSGKPVLFPIRIDDAVMNTAKAWAADLRRTRHIGDFENWKDDEGYRRAFDRLLRDLTAD
jgi:uncharacterized protein YjbI with pentapeptide repeats